MNTLKKDVLVGARQHFALAFTFDPSVHTEPYNNEETSSWGHLQFWVDGINLCAHLENGETVNEVSWYGLPLVEWLANNWDALFHEQKIPLEEPGAGPFTSEPFAAETLEGTALPPPSYTSEQQVAKWEDLWYRWFSSHSIGSALEGAISPDIVLRRWRDSIEFSWTAYKPAGAPDGFRFIYTRGGRRIRPSLVSEPAFDFITECTNYLINLHPDSARLKRLAKAVKAVQQPDPESGKRYAYLAGLGTNANTLQRNWSHFIQKALASSDQKFLRRLIDYKSTAKILPGTGVATLLFGCLSPTITQGDLDVLTNELLRSDVSTTTGFFTELVASRPIDSSISPWDQGYELAQQVWIRIKQRTAFDSSIPIRDILANFGIPIREISLLDQTIRAISIAIYDDEQAVIMLNKSCGQNNRESGRRFTLAHELAHLLFDRGLGTNMSIASGPWAPPDIEKRANAFAAMLLMPPELINANIPPNRRWTQANIKALANKLDTGYKATLEHVANLKYITSSQLQEIEGDDA